MKNASIAALLGMALSGSGASFAADASQLAGEIRDTEVVVRAGHSRVDKAIDATELPTKSKMNPVTPAHVDEGTGDRDYTSDVKRCGAIVGTDKVLCIVPANRNRDQM